jgi:hypothetical protein
MKKYLITTLLLLIWFTSFCQKDSLVFIKGYNETNYLQYFDSLHRIEKEILKSLNHSYYCYVKFEINSNNEVANFDLIEMPEAPLPALAKKYIKDLFLSSNNKWIKKKIPDSSHISEYLLFSVSLKNKRETIEETLKVDNKYFDFLLTYMPLQAKLKGYSLKDEKSLHLSF